MGGVINWLGGGVVAGLERDVFSMTSQGLAREVRANFFNMMLFPKVISDRNAFKVEVFGSISSHTTFAQMPVVNANLPKK